MTTPNAIMQGKGGGARGRLIARVRALFPEDWQSRPGNRFRRIIERISTFAKEHDVLPSDLAGEAIDLTRRKLTGEANNALAEATRAFAEAENQKIEAELKRRSL